mgnify:FL=1
MKYLRPRLPEKEIELCLDLFDKQEAKKRILKYIEGVFDDAESQLKNCSTPAVSGSFPSLDDATKVAVRISEEAITPPLDAKGQTMFIAGFQECIKWLNVVFGNDR